ncbi:MAG: enoyl-CoA hydratase/isomerase family protein [Acidaminococcales bacterium]|jgi:enoyl-CoA hydratase|nr:enoyl-CoA hydratase/isomerase family protein [Acidaminococcales bacterium]
MTENCILTEKKDSVGLITVNRPKVRNALNNQAWEELHAAFLSLEKDAAVRVVIVTGAGDKAFVAGADLNMLKERSSVETFCGAIPGFARDIANLRKPTIAMINGFALGGGLELAMACDIRIASDDAQFGQTEANVGILPGYGGTQRLARLIGLGRAKELVFTGRIISAPEAEKIGLVNRVVPKAELWAETMKMAESIAAKSPLITRAAKLVMNSGAESDLPGALDLELFAQSFAFSTQDHLEGINAFLEKREARFTGK